MSKVIIDISMSLDGFIAGPNGGPQNPRAMEVVKESFARTGAYVMGSRMFGEGEVVWQDFPPFRAPVFVLTSRVPTKIMAAKPRIMIRAGESLASNSPRSYGTSPYL